MKKTILALCLLLSVTLLPAQVLNDTQLIKAGHWIYDALFTLCMETKAANLAENAPLSVAELRFCFRDIDYDMLSESGRVLYGAVRDFLYTPLNLFGRSEEEIAAKPHLRFFEYLAASQSVQFAFNVRVAPELYYKSNPDIGWTFRYFYHDNVASLPLMFGFADYFSVETEFFLGKNYCAATSPYNFTNLPVASRDTESLWPRYAYASTGFAAEKWGVNLNVAKEGLTIGRTQTGSIIYNSTFETDGYVQLNLWARPFKFSMDVVEVNKESYLYLHQLSIRPFRWIKVGVLEGTLVNYPFEVRYLNPFMIMHSYSGWNLYADSSESAVYGEAHYCAYLGLYFDMNPARHLRVYGLFAQNEIQLGGELNNDGDKVPNSLGGQLGVELNIPVPGSGFWVTTLEGIYTSPYMYIKQGAEWSLVSYRHDEVSWDGSPVKSWIGTPYGPDCFGLQYRFGYKKTGKWSAEADYLFTAHGEIGFSTLEERSASQKDSDSDARSLWYSYYPLVAYRLGLISADEATARARNMWLSGTVEFKHQFALKGEYYFLPNLSAGGQAVYTFVLNNQNRPGVTAHGVELSVFVEWDLF